MGRNTKWTEELKNEMVKFFEEAEKTGGKSVLENAEAFAQQHENLTASQVKTAYYKFFEEMQKQNNKTNNRWSKEEDARLLKAVSNKNGTLTSVFDEFAKTTNRTPQNVSQHYYFLMRQNNKVENQSIQQKNNKMQNNNKMQTNQWTKKNKAESIERLNKSLKKLPVETLENLYHIVNAMNKKA